MPVIRAAGRDFHYQELGPPEAPAAVLIHGLVVGSLASWYFTIAPRLAARRRVVIYDQRGHGRSGAAADGYDLSTLAADLAALLDAWRIDAPIDVGGHSYGGAIALRFALDHPDRVRSLIVIDAPLPPLSEGDAHRLVAGDKDTVMSRLPESVAAAAGGALPLARRVEAALAFRERTSVAQDLIAESGFDSAELTGVRCPVLCVYGDRSDFLEKGKSLTAAIPGARLAILEGGHLLTIEQPARLAATIEEFLEAPGRLDG